MNCMDQRFEDTGKCQDKGEFLNLCFTVCSTQNFAFCVFHLQIRKGPRSM